MGGDGLRNSSWLDIVWGKEVTRQQLCISQLSLQLLIMACWGRSRSMVCGDTQQAAVSSSQLWLIAPSACCRGCHALQATVDWRAGSRRGERGCWLRLQLWLCCECVCVCVGGGVTSGTAELAAAVQGLLAATSCSPGVC